MIRNTRKNKYRPSRKEFTCRHCGTRLWIDLSTNTGKDTYLIFKNAHKYCGIT